MLNRLKIKRYTIMNEFKDEENEVFLKEFNYFRDHPEEYKIKKEGFFEATIFTFFLVFLLILAVFDAMKIHLSEMLLIVPVAYLLIVFISLYKLAGHLSNINKRYYDFNRMVYKEKASRLFGDINHPVLKKFKDVLVEDFNKLNGISGKTAYRIHYHMTDDKIKKAMQERERAMLAVEEIENI